MTNTTDTTDTTQGFDTETGEGFSFDMTSVEENKFPVIPTGTYDGVIETLEHKISKSSGQPMWSVRLGLTVADMKNPKVFTFMSFSEKARSMTKSAIKTFAPELLQMTDFQPKAIADEGVLLGRSVRVKVAIEKDDNGDERNVIKGWIKPSGTAGGFAL